MGGYKATGKKLRRAVASLLIILLCAGAFAVIWRYLDSASSATDSQGRELLEKSLWQAVTVCYSIEGIYPPTVEYICNNYGVVIDNGRYAVFYNVFADNILPEITVVPLY